MNPEESEDLFYDQVVFAVLPVLVEGGADPGMMSPAQARTKVCQAAHRIALEALKNRRAYWESRKETP